MSEIQRFEEINAWKKARGLVRDIYEVSSSGDFADDWSLKDQIRRAAISVMSNIAEGYGRDSDKEFSRFLNIALGSVTEVKSQLYVARDLGYLEDNEFKTLYKQAEEVAKLTHGFREYLKEQE